MFLSIVTTLYYSEKNIVEFVTRVCNAAEKITRHYEIILVNDGSPDNSLVIAVGLAHQNRNIKIIDLSRNFGQHRALMTGLSYSKGDLVFFIDSDLEISPENLQIFYQNLQNNKDYDAIFGVQKKRQGGFLNNITGNLFYRIICNISEVDLPSNTLGVRLMTRRYVNSLLLFKEQEIFMSGLFHITGYKQLAVEVDKKYKGKTSYTLGKRIRIFFNAISAFSNKPLEYIFYTGCFISMLSMFYIFFLLVDWLFFAHPLKGWPSLIVSIWFLGGLIILFIGIIGIYLSRVFAETKNRPYTIVKEIIYNENEKTI